MITKMLIAAVTAVGLLASPVAASAAPAVDHVQVAKPKKKAKIKAQLEKTQVKVGEKTKVKGAFEVEADGLTREEESLIAELLIVQQLKAGVWVDIPTWKTRCKPNGNYAVKLSFDVAADVQLRVSHPESDGIEAAVSANLGLKIVL